MCVCPGVFHLTSLSVLWSCNVDGTWRNCECGVFVEWHWQAEEEVLGDKRVSHFFHHKSHADCPASQRGSPPLQPRVWTVLFSARLNALMPSFMNISLMCSMSVRYIIQKTLNTNRCTKSFFSSMITQNYKFRPGWVIFREKPSVVVTLCCTIQFSETVLLTVHCAVYGGVNSF
jgi:hypothetical protein